MSGASSSAAGWSSRLEPIAPPADLIRRADDPRLGEIVEFGKGESSALEPDRAVLIGFPQDEGVRRNYGRPGAAAAPGAIRRWLYRLSAWDGLGGNDLSLCRPLDLGDLRVSGSLEESQEALGEVVAAILSAGAIPLVLGGGHETAYGHFLGYVRAGQDVSILNLDAHLDVRPLVAGRGHSGSPFRQALEHPSRPLPGAGYVCLGVQPGSLSKEHLRYCQDRGATIRFADAVRDDPCQEFVRELNRLATQEGKVFVTLDADVVESAAVPGVSAPNPLGLDAARITACARLAGTSPFVSSLDLVEINPAFDPSDLSARWAALTVWNFLGGLTQRRQS
jgi:formiminoglutamase